MTFKKRICIDLDGVLNNYTKFDESKIPPVKEGAEAFLKTLSEEDYELYLFTTRNKLLASKWLIENSLDKYFKDVVSEKIISWLYIDDRAINFDGNFEKLLNNIKNFKVYWKE